MNILITGGLGYIGSHTVVEAIQNDHNIIIIDNLSNSKIEVLDKLEKITKRKIKYFNIDVTNEFELEKVLKVNKIDGVIHCAGYKSINESIKSPIKYYYNNINSTLTLSKLCIKYNINKFIFSSSATVYGNQKSPLNEDMKLKKTTNPYGETKIICERILTDIANVNPKFKITLLRYFNPIGANESGLIGETPKGIPNNLLPYITKVAKGELKKLYIYGDDYETIDGTGVRDYIHVVDLAKGHIKAMEYFKENINTYNLGTGKGTSVLELLNTFMDVNKVYVPYEITNRREGDLAISYADVNKAYIHLGWKAELEISDMVKDAWNYEIKDKS